jgi:hypothetical protein
LCTRAAAINEPPVSARGFNAHSDFFCVQGVCFRIGRKKKKLQNWNSFRRSAQGD